MQYIFLDLEMNQPYKIDPLTKRLLPGEINKIVPQEIIEIGAIKLNEDLENIGEFQSFVRPDVYMKLHPKISDMTKIKIKDLYTGQYFGKVLKSFTDWIGNESCIIYVWGREEKQVLIENIQFHRIRFEYVPWLDSIINLQKKANEIYRRQYGRNDIGLKRMLTHYKIPIDIKQHRAINDAIYLSRIFIKMFCRLRYKSIMKLIQLE